MQILLQIFSENGAKPNAAEREGRAFLRVASNGGRIVVCWCLFYVMLR